MNEFIEKLICRLEEKANQTWLVLAERNGYERAIENDSCFFHYELIVLVERIQVQRVMTSLVEVVIVG